MLSAIIAVMTVAYVAITMKLPGIVKLVPEMIAALMIPYIIAAGSRQRLKYIHPKYWAVFAILAFSMICGLLVNDVDAGPAVAGMRSYLRVVPLFLLPAVWHFTEEQIGKQLRLLLALSLLQVPVAAFQRWQVWRQGRFTGDQVVGTLNDSGILSIFLICAIAVLVGLLMRKHISKLWFTVLFFVLLVPTTINETKVTVILLPMGLLTALVVGSQRGKRLQIVAAAGALLITFGAIFIPVYNLMQERNPYAKDITTFFTDSKQLNSYLEAKHAGVGAATQVGRVDALRIPVQYLSRDPVHLVFGLGIGNASDSSLGKSFTGKYTELFERITITAFSTFTLELGVLGTGLVFLLYAMIFFDSLYVARTDEGIVGALAIGWTAVTAMMAVSTMYTNIQVFESLSFLFWFFSGLICARRMEVALGAVAPTGFVEARRGAATRVAASYGRTT